MQNLDGKRYVFDLDNTLCITDGVDYMRAKPIKERIEYVNKLFRAGAYIIVDTARGSGSGEDWQIRTAIQLHNWGLYYNELICGVKPYADTYIDDKGINSEDFFNGSN